MARDNRRNGMWEDGFQDISSDSHRPPAPGARRPPNRPPDHEIPRWDGRPRREPAPEERRPRSGRPQRGGSSRPAERPRRRGRKPISAGARRLMMAVTVLIMAAATALLAIFLLFKVSDIQITGDAITGCTNEDILAICGYKAGDNLFFISTTGKEKELKEKLPYVEEAQISRHLPSTIEIHLTGAAVVSCVEQNGSWLYLSSGGKILEQQEKPKEGVMQVSGLDLPETKTGQVVAIPEPEAPEAKESSSSGTSSKETEEDQAYQKALHNFNAFTAYRAVAEKLAAAGAAGAFTWLDLNDLSNIRLIYRDHIEFRLGSAVELEYKIDLGLTSVAELAGYSSYQEMAEAGGDAKETGVLDLSSSDESKRAYFTEGAITAAPITQPAGQGGGPAAGTVTPAPSPTPSPSPNPRQEGIPNSAFTGEGSSASGDSAAGSTDDGNTDDGYTDDGYTDDGYTDDGYTDDGYTDDGYTDDGYTDGGYTDDGYTDGGYTDGGDTWE